MAQIEGISDKELNYILVGVAPEAITRAYWVVKIDETPM